MTPEDPRFERAVRRALRRLSPWVAQRIGEDIAQECRIALWLDAHQHPPSNVALWCATREQRAFLGWRTKNKAPGFERRGRIPVHGYGHYEVLEPTDGLWEDIPADPPPDVDPFIERAVARALERLSEQDRTLLTLRFWEELTLSEIAHRIGKSVPRVSILVQKAQDRFRKAFKELAQ